MTLIFRQLISRYLIFRALMLRTMNLRISCLILFGCCLPNFALALDWQSVPSRPLTLFFPGAAAWESLLIKDSHDGATAVRKRESCISCHKGEEAQMGTNIATNKEHRFYLENSGIGSLQASFSIMRDDGFIYFRIGFDNVNVSQVSLIIDDGAFDSSALSGCWAACHLDAKGLPAAAGLELTKYLSRSRTKNSRTGGGESYKTEQELSGLIDANEFVELLGAKFSDDQSQGLQGYILESRHLDVSSAVKTQLSKADNISYVEIARPLASYSATEKSFVEGGTYSIGIAVHLDTAKGVRHLVSLPVNFTLVQEQGIEFIDED
jgi:hypothetical protein